MSLASAAGRKLPHHHLRSWHRVHRRRSPRTGARDRSLPRRSAQPLAEGCHREHEGSHPLDRDAIKPARQPQPGRARRRPAPTSHRHAGTPRRCLGYHTPHRAFQDLLPSPEPPKVPADPVALRCKPPFEDERFSGLVPDLTSQTQSSAGCRGRPPTWREHLSAARSPR
jgi:hypothetical protein